MIWQDFGHKAIATKLELVRVFGTDCLPGKQASCLAMTDIREVSLLVRFSESVPTTSAFAMRFPPDPLSGGSEGKIRKSLQNP